MNNKNIQVGDKVKVINNIWVTWKEFGGLENKVNLNGSEGVIIGIYDDCVTLQFDDKALRSSGQHNINYDDVEKVDNIISYKKGDRVRIINFDSITGLDPNKNDIGNVVEDNGKYVKVNIKNDIYEWRNMYRNSIEPLNDDIIMDNTNNEKELIDREFNNYKGSLSDMIRTAQREKSNIEQRILDLTNELNRIEKLRNNINKIIK